MQAASLFGVYDPDAFRDLLFELLYTQHGGSGLNLTLHDLDALPLDWLRKFYDKLVERREAEVSAIRRANAGRK